MHLPPGIDMSGWKVAWPQPPSPVPYHPPFYVLISKTRPKKLLFFPASPFRSLSSPELGKECHPVAADAKHRAHSTHVDPFGDLTPTLGEQLLEAVVHLRGYHQAAADCSGCHLRPPQDHWMSHFLKWSGEKCEILRQKGWQNFTAGEQNYRGMGNRSNHRTETIWGDTYRYLCESKKESF